MSQKTVSISWVDRVKQSVGGIVIGLVLVVGMVGLLFWNEGRAVQTERSLDEGAGLVTTVSAAAVDAANEGRLVHLAGQVVTSAPVIDPEFSISAEGIRLMRKVEMYQWVESSSTEKKIELGGSETQVTTYNYALQWSDTQQDSSRFNDPQDHGNPEMLVKRGTFDVASATLGAFTLGDDVLDRVGGGNVLALTDANAEAVQAAVGAGIRASIVNGNIYLGRDPSTPQLGDYRISYEYVPVSTISIVGKQTGSTFAPFRTQGGDSLLMVHDGVVAAEDMFESAASGNATMTWVLRALGVALLIAGFGAVLGPISVIASVLPFLGGILGFGTGIIAGVAGIAVGALTIGSAWLFYRPLLAIAIFAVAALIIAALVFLGRKKATAAQAEAAA